MIKDDPELRHVLAHMASAIEHLSNQKPNAALYEMHQIENLIYFSSEASMIAYLEDTNYGKEQPMQCETESKSKTREEEKND